jgi:hypothetical protein
MAIELTHHAIVEPERSDRGQSVPGLETTREITNHTLILNEYSSIRDWQKEHAEVRSNSVAWISSDALANSAGLDALHQSSSLSISCGHQYHFPQ